MSGGIQQYPPVGPADQLSSELSHVTLQPRAKHTGIRKVKSMDHGTGTEYQSTVEYMSLHSKKTKPLSPVQANSKRRRSLPPTIHDLPYIQRRPRHQISTTCVVLSSKDGRTTTPRSQSVHGDGTLLARNHSEPSNVKHVHSRGRSRRRPSASIPPISFPEVTQLQLDDSSALDNKSHKGLVENSDWPYSIREGAKLPGENEGKVVNQLSNSGHLTSKTQMHEDRRLAKGRFLVREEQQLEKFRFPGSNTQQKPIWRQGDGFSGDEATPSFTFYLTGHKKRRRPRSLPGLGTLSIGETMEHKSSIRDAYNGLKTGRSSSVRQVKRLRGASQEIWPTYDDFMDNTLPSQPKQPCVPEDAVTTLGSNEEAASQTMPTFKPQLTTNSMPLQRKNPLDFQLLISSVKPDEHRKATDAMMRMKAVRYSSPLNDMSREPSESFEDMTSVISTLPESEHNLSSSVEDDSSSLQSDGTVHSYWDEDVNHLYPEDVRELKRQRRHFSVESQDQESVDTEDGEG